MAHLHKVLLILALLFLAVDANLRRHHIHDRLSFSFPNFFDQEHSNDDDDNNSPTFGGILDIPKFFDQEHSNDDDDGNNSPISGGTLQAKKGDFEIGSTGSWEIINKESGVSAMHINLLPTNKMIVYDAKVYRTSRIKLPEGAPCIPYRDGKTKEDKLDCFAHAVEYDIETNEVRPLRIGEGDPWCSSGGLAPDGTLVSTGGFFDGAKTIRYFGGDCTNCEWREYNNVLKDERWYGSQQILATGDFIVVGGRRAFSYEFVPRAEGQASEKPYFFPFLYETSDLDENNLYPFIHLSTDGNLFIFSNNRSLLLNPTTNKVIRTFPVLPGGSRNYPASGMSALLPIDLEAAASANATAPVKAEVIVCGGNLPHAFDLAERKKIFLPALSDCSRMTITDPKPTWDTEIMPSARTMGDSLVLPNGQILLINGAMLGTAAWWDAEGPNFHPVIYSPEKPKGTRFKVLKASQIARMYHSSSAVLPSGKIWVAGSNTHDTYKDNDKYPTETRVEAFSPPYLDANFAKYRPKIDEAASVKDLRYGKSFETQFSVEDYGNGLSKADVKVTMYYPPFTTHGVSMGQRLVVLKKEGVREQEPGVYKVTLEAPPSGAIAPPGYYMLFVVHRGLPSPGMWVRIQ